MTAPPAAHSPETRDKLVVTTAYRANDEMYARARAVAERCAVPLVPRQSLPKLRARAQLVYVVGKAEEFVFSEHGRLIAGEGLLKLKRVDGRQHPLHRAVAPDGIETSTVFDGTMGMGQDALHLAVVSGLSIDGVDASPALVCLVENFMVRAAERWADAPSRVRVRVGSAEAALASLSAGAYDVVYLDPMFDVAMPSQPDFVVLRDLACDAPLTTAVLAEATRVARQRVVVKVRTLARPTAAPPAPGWNRRVAGRAFNYWIIEKALSAPTLEPLRVKYSHQRLRWLGLM